MEVEAKFRCLRPIAPEQVEAVAIVPFRWGERTAHTLHDTLLDSASGVLAAQRLALRLRDDSGTRLLTLKGPKVQRGATSWRAEWEAPLGDGSPDEPRSWPPQIAQRVIPLLAGAPLQPLFQIHNQRVTWLLWEGARAVAEVALDRGTIHAGALREPLHELEVEQKEGSEAELDAIAARLRAALPLAEEPRGKAQRGFALLRRARL